MKRFAGLVSVGLAASAQGQFFWHLEDFDDGTNAAQWTFGVPTQTFPAAGGYPCCKHLRSGVVEGAVPMVGTSPGPSTPFTGDYRAVGITSLAAYMKVNETNQVLSTVRPAVLLYSANGTPADPTDDWGAFKIATLPLPPLGQWQLFSFGIPSGQTSLPAGWAIVRLGAAAPASPDWNVLIQSVDRLMFTYGDPSQPAAGQRWDVSFDYVFITNGVTCYPNCDGSTAWPCLNVQDYMCFLNRFAAGDTRANCDASTIAPVLTVMDFACFLMSMAAGCTGC